MNVIAKHTLNSIRKNPLQSFVITFSILLVTACMLFAFNVKGIYYDRKGNNISKMTKRAVESLDESFRRLCNILNSDAVEINEAEDCIKVYDDSYKAVITDSRITLNGDPVNEDELANLASTSRLMNEHKERFFNAVKIINENSI